VRLQPIEIHPKISAALTKWAEFAGDQSLSDCLMQDGHELGKLNSQLAQASLAWSHSANLDELARNPDVAEQLRPPPSDIPHEAFRWLHAESLLSNGQLFRTYVSVVLGRTDEFVAALHSISKRNKNPHLGVAIKLLRNDEVRRLRNAVGHGTFLAKGQVFEYRDGSHERRIAFRELDTLNTSIWTIVLTGLTASYKWKAG
jgi:hypothetical protein